MIRVSEVVTTDEIKKWTNGDIVTIKAGTGAGKSYFIEIILYAFAQKNNKKILMLIHRTNCVNQFQDEVERDGKSDTIDIKTYQYIEAMQKNKVDINFSQYEYIVCDEFHYFMGDASFNKTTDMSLNTILKQTDKIRIFMSATGDYMTNYIKKYRKLDTVDYELPIDFNFIKDLTFYNKDETLFSFAEQAINENKKTIFFIQSAKKAYDLYSKFKDYAVFNCGKSDKHYKYVDENKIKSILSNEKFDDLILITTTAMDAGVNLIDLELTHVVCDVKDKSTLIQCIGRKRSQNKDDKIHLYIKAVSNQQLGGMETQLRKRIEMAQFLKDNTVEEYIEKYQRELDYSHIVYDDVIGEKDKCTKKVNDLMYFKSLIDLNEVSVIKSYGDFSFCRYFTRQLGFYDEYTGFDYRIIEEDKMKNDLEDYLNSIVGVKLFKEEQKELIDKIDLKINRRQQKSCSKLNEALKMISLPFIIISNVDKRRKLEDGSINPDRDKTFWTVMSHLG